MTLRLCRAASLAIALPLVACGGSAQSGHAGGGGSSESGSSSSGAGGCPSSPEPAFDLTLAVKGGGYLPSDTTLDVDWSGGQEPTFALDDVSTWLTLADGTNVECDLDPTATPPVEIASLVCHVWTLGPTHIDASGTGYETWSATLSPDEDETCEEPRTRQIHVALVALTDAGAP